MTESPDKVVRQYHDRTKHRLDGYARGPDTLDWDDQPDPFRRYDGAPLIELPLVANELQLPYSELFAAHPSQPLNLHYTAMLLELSLALSAWKQYGTARWSLRVNPSSGNLHPTETWLITQDIEGLADGVYHYRADVHGLELRCRFPAGDSVAGKQTDPLLYLAFSSVHWREAWKYGERAYRYCQHDVGHAVASLGYAATALGWQLDTRLQPGDQALAALLGLDRPQDFTAAQGAAETEHPDLLVKISSGSASVADPDSHSLSHLCELACDGEWAGVANVLDRRHLYQWPIIDEVSDACLHPGSSNSSLQPTAALLQPMAAVETLPLMSCRTEETAGKLFRRRRSAQAFDGKTVMPQQDFVRCLQQLFQELNPVLGQVAPWTPRIHPVLFVHRVEGVEPGLYALPRSDAGADLLKTAMRPEFQWQPVELPAAPPLFQLILARAERTIAKLSCQQAIAGDSCFSLAMLAQFDSTIEAAAWRYRELFWEAGALGQALYLEAEAALLRGTGIGCYFDDAVHDLLGISDKSLQSLYHFTVGGPLVDHRITTLPPYSAR